MDRMRLLSQNKRNCILLGRFSFNQNRQNCQGRQTVFCFFVFFVLLLFSKGQIYRYKGKLLQPTTARNSGITFPFPKTFNNLNFYLKHPNTGINLYQLTQEMSLKEQNTIWKRRRTLNFKYFCLKILAWCPTISFFCKLIFCVSCYS